MVFVQLVSSRRYFTLRYCADVRASYARNYSESWPLMLNNLLNSIFFRSDIQVLAAFRGARVVGHYEQCVSDY